MIISQKLSNHLLYGCLDPLQDEILRLIHECTIVMLLQ